MKKESNYPIQEVCGCIVNTLIKEEDWYEENYLRYGNYAVWDLRMHVVSQIQSILESGRWKKLVRMVQIIR